MANEDFDLDELIAHAWALVGRTEESKERGIGIENLITIADQNNKGKMPETVINWLKIYDQVAAWYTNLTMLFTIELLLNKETSTKRQRALVPVLSNISGHIIALRRLVSAGLDVQGNKFSEC